MSSLAPYGSPRKDAGKKARFLFLFLKSLAKKFNHGNIHGMREKGKFVATNGALEMSNVQTKHVFLGRKQKMSLVGKSKHNEWRHQTCVAH